MRESPDRWFGAASAAFAIALLVFGATLVRAVRTDPIEPAPAPRAAPDATETTGAGVSLAAIQLVAENDPFRPDRQRSPERYRMPGDVEPMPEPEPEPLPPAPEFRLHGTIVDPAGQSSAVLIAVEDEGPRFLPVGGTIAGFRVTQVAPQAAVVSDGSQDLLLRVPGPQAAVAAADPRENNRRNQGRNTRETREEQARMRQLQQTLERAQQSGASPQMIEALRRAIEQRQGGGAVMFEVRERETPVPPPPGDRVIIRRDTTDSAVPDEPAPMNQPEN